MLSFSCTPDALEKNNGHQCGREYFRSEPPYHSPSTTPWSPVCPDSTCLGYGSEGAVSAVPTGDRQGEWPKPKIRMGLVGSH